MNGTGSDKTPLNPVHLVTLISLKELADMAYMVRDTLTGRCVRVYARTRLDAASYMVSELNRREPGRYVVVGWGVDRMPEPASPVPLYLAG